MASIRHTQVETGSRHVGKMLCRHEDRDGWCVCECRYAHSCQQTTPSWGRGMEQILPWGPQKEPTLTLRLLPLERWAKFLSLKSLSCGTLLGSLSILIPIPQVTFLERLGLQVWRRKKGRCSGLAIRRAAIFDSPSPNSCRIARSTWRFQPESFWMAMP